MSGLERFFSSDFDGVFGAFRLMNPDQVKTLCGAEFKVGLVVRDEAEERSVMDWITEGLDQVRTIEAQQYVTSVFYPLSDADAARLGDCDIRIACGREGAAAARKAGLGHYVYADGEGNRLAGKLAEDMGVSAVPVARVFPAFRAAVCRDIVEDVALQNTFWAVATAFPHVLPNPLEAWTSAAELAGDTAVMTINEMRMAFLLAAATGHRVGLARQWAELAAIVGSGVGVSALAGAVVGHIPAGGGLLAKGALAFTSTVAVGASLSFWYQTGSRMKPGDLEKLVQERVDEAKEAIRGVVEQVKGIGAVFTPEKKDRPPEPEPDPANGN